MTMQIRQSCILGVIGMNGQVKDTQFMEGDMLYVKTFDKDYKGCYDIELLDGCKMENVPITHVQHW